jgi:NAD-dependent SIR2 family protein deacetylase
MNVAFACPKCDQTVQVELSDDVSQLACSHCEYTLNAAAGAISQGEVHRCLVCGGNELFVRKNFSQRLGVTIVVLGFVASSVTWYLHQVEATFGILFATALIDVVLYLCVGNLLQCYGCRSEYRGVAGLDQHEPFDLEVHERHRQQAARLAESTKPLQR